MSLQQDENADKAILAMVAGMTGISIIPAYVNWPFTASALGAGVIAIGLCYEVHLSKDDAWKLVTQFFTAAGFWFTAGNFGGKFISMILASTGVGYMGGVVLDLAISVAAAYGIGGAAKAYFKGERNNDRLGEVFRDNFTKNKK
jgi:predicted permease